MISFQFFSTETLRQRQKALPREYTHKKIYELGMERAEEEVLKKAKNNSKK
jgi:hypothetical protein